MASPKPLWQSLDAIAKTLGEADQLHVGSDCDGTLAEIADHPGFAQVSPRVLGVLERLALAPGVHVGIFSGRRLDDLLLRFPIPGAFFAGTAGLETRDERGQREIHLAAGHGLPPELSATLRAWCERFAGAWLEDKGVALAVHYRGVAPRFQPAFCSGLRRRFADLHTRIEWVHGKKVFEVMPRPGRDKGDAVTHWLPSDWARRAVFYFGDDSNDEPVFPRVRQRGGITVVVGRRASSAEYRLDDPRHVGWFIEWLEREWNHAHAVPSTVDSAEQRPEG